MNKLEKLKEASLFKRKVILFAVLFVLAVPMAVLMGRGFARKVSGFDKEPLFEQFEMNDELGESFLQFQETREDLKEFMNQMPEISTTSTSTEFSTSTYTDDINDQ